jgi:hypothetical protein
LLKDRRRFLALHPAVDIELRSISLFSFHYHFLFLLKDRGGASCIASHSGHWIFFSLSLFPSLCSLVRAVKTPFAPYEQAGYLAVGIRRTRAMVICTSGKISGCSVAFCACELFKDQKKGKGKENVNEKVKGNEILQLGSGYTD